MYQVRVRDVRYTAYANEKTPNSIVKGVGNLKGFEVVTDKATLRSDT
jgi:hypothetical protein